MHLSQLKLLWWFPILLRVTSTLLPQVCETLQHQCLVPTHLWTSSQATPFGHYCPSTQPFFFLTPQACQVLLQVLCTHLVVTAIAVSLPPDSLSLHAWLLLPFSPWLKERPSVIPELHSPPPLPLMISAGCPLEPCQILTCSPTYVCTLSAPKRPRTMSF